MQVARRDAQKLQVDDLSFHFPSGFSRLSNSSAGDPSSASWMLKGDACQVTVHSKDKETTLSYLSDRMAEFYESLSEVSELERRPPHLVVQGSRVSATRFLMQTRDEGHKFQDYSQLPVRSSRFNYFLVLHGKPNDPSEQQARSMIGGALR